MSHELNPDDALAALDAIRTSIPDHIPSWTENILFVLNDPKTGVAIYSHLGRLQPDRRIWEGLALIFLPDGSRLVSRSMGVCVDRARNGEYDYRPIVPTRLWRFDFDGVVQRVTANDMRVRAVGDDPYEAASYHFTFEGIHPTFNMHQSTADSGRMHLDQGGRVQGVLKTAGQTVVIDCYGYRDHSCSHRVFLTLESETWPNCVFPSGRIVSYQEVRRKERQVLEGMVLVDGRMRLVRPLVVPQLADTAGAPHEGILKFNAEGEIIEIAWRTSPDRCLPFQLLHPVGLRPGIDRNRESSLVAIQCPCEFVWDGEVGHGWLERVRPLATLSDA